MDSGNSGSLQSSSGGDDQEFESSSSISSFLNPSTHFNSISAPNPPFDFPHQNPTLFDPQYSINNHNDLFWSRGLLRSEPINHPNFGNLATPSQPSSSAHPRAEGGARGGAAPVLPQSNVIKNPKKRTRASRRAPTTVLTTDTTNFRQMVQEFTGIPAAPFSGSPYSRRLDLFAAPPPLFPLRPAIHNKMNLSPPLLSSASNLGASSSNNPNNYPLSGGNLLNLQQNQMNFGNLSGFLGAQVVKNNDDRWKSGETVRSNDGGQENLVSAFDGNINTTQNMSSGYNLNLTEKGMENVGSSGAEATVASWICPSD
ncbi:hypothetical protein CDL12_25412 [Handroanthus impetiginosus]|uniref:VQ domain-containing protein n=1 Tax=Handroanthus impetiginosus TaxID=429701 RepID=A0A2G9G9W0_9LAMI|nr:hypothetical protein CDL12_25412 [Handroanthus impetiginosus]